MRKLYYPVMIFITCLFFGCGPKEPAIKEIIVRNSMERDRESETVEVSLASLGMGDIDAASLIVITNTENGENLVSQTIDENGDGIPETILFQPEIKASSTKVFKVTKVSGEIPKYRTPACYSRFVPERTDDYAWENNRVAFRTYGPTAQKMVEDKIDGGTLSSGIDAWLKKVEYPIINAWYEKTTTGKGSYHEDTGEGLDNFHVGASRGVGGVAIKEDSTYYFSKNFTTWKTLYTGPIRTSFVLTYADWRTSGKEISEEKRISLDYGSNLSRFEIALTGADTLSAGVTLHEKDGAITINEGKGWISYWEPHEDSELGMGIIVPGNFMVGYEEYLTDKKDQSNLYVHIRTHKGMARYYAGFGWKKSGQFKTKSDWENYLTRFSEQLEHPLEVTLK
jgi:hypothetical protein